MPLTEKSEMTQCFECGEVRGLHNHHVVPRSLGGTKTIPLCERCHGLVHEKDLRIGALTSRAMRKRLDAGQYIGGHAPYGFQNVNGLLVEVPHELDAIRQARELRARPMTLRAVAAELESRGILSRAGKPFTPSTVQVMVAT